MKAISGSLFYASPWIACCGFMPSDFVVDRKRLAATPRLAALVRQVRGEQGSVEEGISFREFISCILSFDPAEQHPLWAPQYRYLQALGDCDKLYRSDQLAILAKDLNQRCGVEAVIPDAALRVAPLPDIAGTGTKTVGAYADCLPAQLPGDASEWRDQLLDAQLGELILKYYERDCELYNRCAGNHTSE